MNTVWFALIFLALVNVISSGGNFTEVERKALEKFRILVGPELYQDFMRRDEYLIRWIRDQEFNLERAQRKLLDSLNWRKENNVDSVLTEDFSEVERLCPYSVDGRDNSGRPILAMSLGACPVRRVVLSGNINKLHRMIYFGFEFASAIVQDLQFQGKSVTDGVVIGDINNFSWREHACVQCIPIAIDAITLYESHYPQYVHEVHVLNVPRSFQSLYAIVSAFISEYNRNIIHFHGYNKEEWKAAILKNISPDQLEPQFGGTKKPNKFVPTSGPGAQALRLASTRNN